MDEIGWSGLRSNGRNSMGKIGWSGFRSNGRNSMDEIGWSGFRSNGRNSMGEIGWSGFRSNGRNSMGEIGNIDFWSYQIFPEITPGFGGGPHKSPSALKEIAIFRNRNTQHAKWNQQARRVSPEIFTSSASVHSSGAIYKQGRARVPPRAHLGHFTRCHAGTATTTGSLAQSDRSLGPRRNPRCSHCTSGSNELSGALS